MEGYVGRFVEVKRDIGTRTSTVWGVYVEVLAYNASTRRFKIKLPESDYSWGGRTEPGWKERELIFPPLEPDWEV